MQGVLVEWDFCLESSYSGGCWGDNSNITTYKKLPVQPNKNSPQKSQTHIAAYSDDMVKGVTAISGYRNRQIEVLQVLDAVVE